MPKEKCVGTGTPPSAPVCAVVCVHRQQWGRGSASRAKWYFCWKPGRGRGWLLGMQVVLGDAGFVGGAGFARDAGSAGMQILLGMQVFSGMHVLLVVQVLLVQGSGCGSPCSPSLFMQMSCQWPSFLKSWISNLGQGGDLGVCLNGHFLPCGTSPLYSCFTAATRDLNHFIQL